jgi:hypothetical protein
LRRNSVTIGTSTDEASAYFPFVRRSCCGGVAKRAAMDDLERIDLIMQEIGPRDDGIDQVLRLDEEIWAVRFADVDIEAEFDAPSRRLMLSADIGAPPADLQAHMYEAALTYSMLWRDTGGVRMAISESGGPITHMADLHCSDLTAATMAIVLRNFNDRTLIWRKYIEGVEDGPPGPEPLDATIIRA